MAWAVAAAQPHESSPPQSQPAYQDAAQGGADSASTGVLLYPGAESSETQEDTQSSSQETAENSAPSSATQPAKQAEERATGGTRTSGNATGAHRESAQSAAASKPRTKTIHHTAYKRIAVYKTVTHKAAVKHVTTVDGETVTTWTLCPVCGQRHGKSYTQKVLSDYKNVYCEACGEKHSKSYTETVRY